MHEYMTRARHRTQAIQQEGPPSSESDVGRISARLRDKGKDYGEFWGARATGSSDRYDEYTWFIRSASCCLPQSCDVSHQHSGARDACGRHQRKTSQLTSRL